MLGFRTVITYPKQILPVNRSFSDIKINFVDEVFHRDAHVLSLEQIVSLVFQFWVRTPLRTPCGSMRSSLLLKICLTQLPKAGTIFKTFRGLNRVIYR
jgi:hypothetical protein